MTKFLNCPLISDMLSRNSFLITLFPNIHHLCSSFKVREPFDEVFSGYQQIPDDDDDN